MKKISYWISILIGFIIAVLVFSYYSNAPYSNAPYSNAPYSNALNSGAPDSKAPFSGASFSGEKAGGAVIEDFATQAIPESSSLKLYINAFNMPVNVQNNVSFNLVLAGYNTSNPFTELLQSILASNIIATLNLSPGSVHIINSASDASSVTLSIIITYNTAQAATSALGTIISQLTSATFMTSLVNAGVTYLTGITNGTPPTQGTSLTTTNNTYQGSINKWYDYSRNSNTLANTIEFTLVSTSTIPSQLQNLQGLPLNGVKMLGPASTNYGDANDYLTAFTTVWYMTINSFSNIESQSQSSMMLFEMFAETPNVIQLSIQNVDKSTVNVIAAVGSMSSLYQWTIPKTTLMSNGAPMLYTLVYDPVNTSLTFYVGTLAYPSKITTTQNIKLGLSQIIINDTPKYASVDANLFAFALFSTALTQTEIATLLNYFNTELNNVPQLQQIVQQASAKLNVIQQQVATIANSNVQLQQQLQQCSTSNQQTSNTSTNPTPNPSMWQLNLNGYNTSGITTSSLQQCNPLSINSFGTQPTLNPTSSTVTTNTSQLTIPYPDTSMSNLSTTTTTSSSSTSSTSNQQLYYPSLLDSSTSTTDSSSSTSSSSTSSTSGFWQKLFLK